MWGLLWETKNCKKFHLRLFLRSYLPHLVNVIGEYLFQEALQICTFENSLCFSSDHIFFFFFFNFSITVFWHPLVFALIYERICRNIEKIQLSTLKIPYILNWRIRWNELEPSGTRWDQQRTDTHTKEIIGEYCVCTKIDDDGAF